MAKAPLLGRTKTRLSKGLASRAGSSDAADALTLRLSTSFLVDSAALCGRWRREVNGGVDGNRRLVFYVDPDHKDAVLVDLAFQAGARIEPQVGNDLGERLQNAFDAEFARGARAVCAIGSDSPHLPLHLVDHAFRALLWERAILGPTFDGGYWLVGAQRPAPELFRGIPWSTSSVLSSTLALLSSQGASGHLLPFWYDVDDADDLERLRVHLPALRKDDESVAPFTWATLRAAGLIDDVSPSERTAR